MLLLPYEHLTLKTYLSPDDARQKLANVIEPTRAIRFFWISHRPYQGKVDGSRFKVSRVIRYRNSFLPIIEGEIRPEIEGCSITITMRPHIVTIVFMTIWLGFAVSTFLTSVLAFMAAFSQSGLEDPLSLLSILFHGATFFVFGYLLLMGGFKFESVKSKAFFRDLFEGRL